jgi:hypothetical protein
MLNNNELTIKYLNRAIKSFDTIPFLNESNKGEVYELLLMMYHFKSDTAKHRTTLMEKIDAEPDSSKSVGDYRNLSFHFYQIGELEKSKYWSKKTLQIDSMALVR